MNMDSQWCKQQACFVRATEVWPAVNHTTSVTFVKIMLSYEPRHDMIGPAMSGRPGRLLSVIEVIPFREKNA